MNKINFEDWKNSRKKSEKINDKKAAQIKKFSTCRICGGQMTYVKGTNILVCECDVQKKVKSGGEEKIVTEKCGNTNIVDKAYQDYLNYLFN